MCGCAREIIWCVRLGVPAVCCLHGRVARVCVIHACMHVYEKIYAHAQANTFASLMFTHTYINTCVHAYTNIHDTHKHTRRAYIIRIQHECTRVYCAYKVYTYMYTHTHMHTDTQNRTGHADSCRIFRAPSHHHTLQSCQLSEKKARSASTKRNCRGEEKPHSPRESFLKRALPVSSRDISHPLAMASSEKAGRKNTKNQDMRFS